MLSSSTESLTDRGVTDHSRTFKLRKPSAFSRASRTAYGEGLDRRHSSPGPTTLARGTENSPTPLRGR